MGSRKGEYVGFWCPPELKKTLVERGQTEDRTLSQEVIHRLRKSIASEDVAQQELRLRQEEVKP